MHSYKLYMHALVFMQVFVLISQQQNIRVLELLELEQIEIDVDNQKTRT